MTNKINVIKWLAQSTDFHSIFNLWDILDRELLHCICKIRATYFIWLKSKVISKYKAELNRHTLYDK